MPVLQCGADGSLRIRGYVDGALAVWEVRPAGADLLEAGGIADHQEVPERLLRILREDDLLVPVAAGPDAFELPTTAAPILSSAPADTPQPPADAAATAHEPLPAGRASDGPVAAGSAPAAASPQANADADASVAAANVFGRPAPVQPVPASGPEPGGAAVNRFNTSAAPVGAGGANRLEGASGPAPGTAGAAGSNRFEPVSGSPVAPLFRTGGSAPAVGAGGGGVNRFEASAPPAARPGPASPLAAESRPQGQLPVQVATEAGSSPTTTPVQARKALLQWGVPAAAVLLLFAVGFGYFSSFSARANRMLKDGRLAAPPGQNLLELTRKRLSGRDASAIAPKLRARISAAAGERVNGYLRQWHDAATVPAAGWQEAAGVAELWKLVAPDDADAGAKHTYLQAQVQFEDGQFDNALQSYRQAQGNANIADLVYNGIAKSCWRLKLGDCAIENYTFAIRTSPAWIYPYQNLAGVYFAKRRLDEAADMYSTVLRMQPDRPYALYQLGEIYVAKRRYAEARTLLERALTLHRASPRPDVPADEIENRLAWLQRRGY